MYSYQSTPVTTTYSTPVQSLHGRAGPDQLLPACPAKVWAVPALAATGHAVIHGAGLWNPDVLDLRLCGPGEYDIRLLDAGLLHDNVCIAGRRRLPAGTDDDPRRHDRGEHGAGLHADDTECSQRNIPATTTVPAEPALQGVAPAQTVPAPPGAGQATSTRRSEIPQRSPR